MSEGGEREWVEEEEGMDEGGRREWVREEGSTRRREW